MILIYIVNIGVSSFYRFLYFLGMFSFTVSVFLLLALLGLRNIFQIFLCSNKKAVIFCSCHEKRKVFCLELDNTIPSREQMQNQFQVKEPNLRKWFDHSHYLGKKPKKMNVSVLIYPQTITKSLYSLYLDSIYTYRTLAGSVK